MRKYFAGAICGMIFACIIYAFVQHQETLTEERRRDLLGHRRYYIQIN